MNRIFSIFLVSISLHLNAQIDQNIEEENIIYSIYNISDSTLSLLEKAKLPEDQFAIFTAYALYWQSINYNNHDVLNQASIILKNANYSADEYALASKNLLQLRIHFSNEQYLPIVSSMFDIRNFLKQYEFDASNEYNMLIWGLYHFFVSEARSSNILAKSYFYFWPESRKEEGLKILNKLAKSKSIFIWCEANYFLGRIFFEFENNPQNALVYFSQLNQTFPKNKIYCDFVKRCEAKIQKKWNKIHCINKKPPFK